MLLAFAGMAKSFKKGPIVTGVGRFLEPIVLISLETILLFQILGKNYKNT